MSHAGIFYLVMTRWQPMHVFEILKLCIRALEGKLNYVWK